MIVSALEHLEAALSVFSSLDMPYECGRTRLVLAEVVAGHDTEAAVADARVALLCFEQLGAARDADMAAAVLRSLGVRSPRTGSKGVGLLTKRELEILGLLGEGRPNRDIGERLYISRRTVEHHVASILSKLGLSGRAEAAGYAVRHLDRSSGARIGNLTDAPASPHRGRSSPHDDDAKGTRMSKQPADASRDNDRRGETAVVVGASMAGLCAARVLSDHFAAVVVVDRDELPAPPEPRRLVPQGRHPHLLLTSGARLLEGWFPGLLAELRAAGAVDVDICGDFYWYQAGGCQRRPASDLRGPAMSRPLLERTVRRRVEALGNVVIRDETAAEGLVADASGERITGIQLSDGAVIQCDLVVDASGRAARSLAWLAELNYQPPPTSIVEVDTRYVSRIYRRTDAPARDWKAAAVIGDPHTRRLAMLLPLEDDRWIVTIAGINGETAPTDPDAMLAYARTLESPVIAEVMEASEPLTDPVTHRFPANQRRHVERMRRFPLGWVLLGDAVSSFNPIYGQGMTTAAQQAEALGRQLDRTGAIDRAFTRAYFKDAGRTVNTPWSIAVGGDFLYDGTTGKKPFGTDLVNRYMDRVIKAGQHDDKVVIRLNETLALLRSPQSLMAPAFALRVLRAARRMGSEASDTRQPVASTATATHP